ncbi:MAG TPA: type II secretion system F family protein [Candidatus Binatia bacterium]|nr:type II secretion system F family protein [Candidatus Binatia bacterium]
MLAAGVAVAIGTFLCVWFLASGAQGTSLLEQRLASLPDATAYDIDLVTGEFTQPFFERALLPILAGIGRVVARRTKEGQLQQLRKLVAKAGSRQRPESVLALRLILPFVFGAVGFLLAQLVASSVAPPENYALPIGGAVLGFMWPTFSLQRKAKKRASEIRLSMPGVLDLLTVCMEAGLTLDMAMMRVTESDKSLLSQDLQKMLNEIRLGRPRGEALLALAERDDVEELTGFVRAVVQAEPLGVSVVNVLRIQSEELRRIRKQRAEEAGHRAPVLMLLPMMGCIFPCIFIVLLGPAAVNLFFSH